MATRYGSTSRAAELAIIIDRYLIGGTIEAPHPKRVAHLVTTMQGYARAAKAGATGACNYGESEAATERRHKRDDKRAEECLDMLYELMGRPGDALPGLSISFGGDPRGHCGILTIPGAPGDSWGAGEYSIY